MSSRPAAPVLPVERVYVVKLGDATRFAGQVEHVLSGRQRHFANGAELLQALRLLETRHPAPSQHHDERARR